MNGEDIAVIVGGLILGYWIVSKVLSRVGRNQSQQNQEQAHCRDSTAGKDSEENGAQDHAEKSTGEPSGHEEGKERDDYKNRDDDDARHYRDDWYVVLGVSSDASIVQIKHAYRVQMSQYHPDKVAELGEEIRALAERKSKEINAAYQIALRVRSAG